MRADPPIALDVVVENRHAAAEAIQGAIEGNTARGEVRGIRSEVEGAAAIALQACVQGNEARSRVTENTAAAEAAAVVTIQARVQVHEARSLVAGEKAASATQIQAAMGASFTRQEVAGALAARQEAAGVIMAAVQGAACRVEQDAAMGQARAEAASVIQGGLLGVNTRQDIQAKPTRDAAETIQAGVQGQRVREGFGERLVQDEAAQVIQAGIHASEGREHVAAGLASGEREAAATIQGGLQGHLVRETENGPSSGELETMNQELESLQRGLLAAPRGSHERGALKSRVDALDRLRSFKQKHYSEAQARQAERRVEQEGAAVVIQAGVKGTEVRQQVATQEAAAEVIPVIPGISGQ